MKKNSEAFLCWYALHVTAIHHPITGQIRQWCVTQTHTWGSCWKYFQFWLQTSLFSPTRWGSHKNSNYLLTSQGSPPLSAGFKAAWCSKKHGAKIGIYLVDVWGIFNLPLGYLLCLQSSRISQSFGQFEYEQACSSWPFKPIGRAFLHTFSKQIMELYSLFTIITESIF